ncbi:hypothetical protein [Bradyrhizobium sp. Gha]|uniref:hypothetical protein n=1 Tax=Bradyrhizobium sp. Gha TaxID=1855318 RepID=UPI0008E3BA58|nr:hypothetical protein [Bradyrhizobium sp. Gha]SFH68963.1 hypothetical protein SAMN05216525_101309 [Bradyrhizobium sp. Gha]
MGTRAIFGALILGGLVALSASPILSAQPTDNGTSTPKDAGASTRKDATPNTNTAPTKHRDWRHRGGTHPHYGSRRIRT